MRNKRKLVEQIRGGGGTYSTTLMSAANYSKLSIKS